MGLVDTHAHLLPFWDDGADSWDNALSMLRMAEADGIDTVVCTPHILSPKDFDHESALLARYDELKARALESGIGLTIYMGSELFVHPELDLGRKISTPAENGRYFLVEFPMSSTPDFVIKTFFGQCPQQKIPVIAHPERYVRVLRNPAEAYAYVEQGALLQLNAGSLLGVFGQTVKDVAFRLMDANLIHLIASDAHDLKMRPLKLRATYQLVLERFGRERADRLFIDNPRRILQAKDVIADPPRAMENTTKRSIWQRIGLNAKG